MAFFPAPPGGFIGQLVGIVPQLVLNVSLTFLKGRVSVVPTIIIVTPNFPDKVLVYYSCIVYISIIMVYCL